MKFPYPAVATLALTALIVAPVVSQATTTQQQVPAHPDDLVYPELDFDPPAALDHRHELTGGAIAFVVEDHELPLVNISLTVRTGTYTSAARAMPGAAEFAGSQMRAGGTASLAPAELDEELDFLAAQMFTGVGSTSANANMNCLTKDLDRCLELFFEVLRQPRFDSARLELARSQLLQQLERRNDSTTTIEGREWNRLLYGSEHFSTEALTADQVAAITRDDLVAFHGREFHPGRFVFAVSGDVARDDILERLDAYLADWPVGEAPEPVPAPDYAPMPGLYLVHKEDVNQGRLSLGHLSTTNANPDRFALQVMNNILGGGGFTSRIMSRVRSDEGLAYSAGSAYSLGQHYDGAFRSFFQSRSEAVARATAIVLEEIENIRTNPVTVEELGNAKASFVDTFSRNFASAAQTAGLFASLEIQDRGFDLLETYRDNMSSVTAEDVMRVAREYLHPDRVVILAVGNVDDMLAGDPDNPDFRLEDFAPNGNIQRIALPDPLSMEYPRE